MTRFSIVGMITRFGISFDPWVMTQRNIIGRIRRFGIEKISRNVYYYYITLLGPIITRKCYNFSFIMAKALDDKGILCCCFFKFNLLYGGIILQVPLSFIYLRHSTTYVIYLLHFIYSLSVTLFS